MDYDDVFALIDVLKIPLGAEYDYWPPEYFVISIDNPVVKGALEYQQLVYAKFKERYQDRATDLFTAFKILTRYHDSFKNRIDGTIIDNWLSRETFADIASHCIEIMDQLPKLKEWQTKLRTRFLDMIFVKAFISMK